MECGMVGWLAGRLVSGSACGSRGGREHCRCVAALSRVYIKQERPHAACKATRRTLIHLRTHALEELTRFPSVFYERSIFRKGRREDFLGNLRPVCFPVAPMAEFSLRDAVIVLVIRRSSHGMRVPTCVGFAECRFRDRANIRREVLGACR